MKDKAHLVWLSVVRTYVPLIVGGVLGWFASRGIPVDPEFEEAFTGILMLVGSGIYYLAVRLFETYVSPKLGWLLGTTKSPDSYSADINETE